MLVKKYLTLFCAIALVAVCALSFSACSHTHEFGDWETKTAPTCTQTGVRERMCTTCSFVESEEMAALGHEYAADSVIVEASCIGNGIMKYACTREACLDSYEQEYALPTYSDTQIYEQSVQYVGEIVVYNKQGTELGLGTCFVYTSDGKIITNYHVIEGAYTAKVTIGQRTYDVTHVLSYDKKIDLAILKIDAEGLVAAKICTNPVQTGSTVFAIGSSRGLTNTYSKGIVTYADREVDGVSHVQHDASITNGNSGGPLINIYAEVIGINTWGILDSQNLNFAVSTTEIENLPAEEAMTMAQFYQKNFVPQDELIRWLKANSNRVTDTDICFDYEYQNAWYSLGYDIKTDLVYIDVLWEFDGGATLYLYIDFEKNTSRYYYYAKYTDGGKSNITKGYINAASFTENTYLTYTTYDGGSWDKNQLLDLYQKVTVNLLGWLDWISEVKQIGVKLTDLGFKVF